MFAMAVRHSGDHFVSVFHKYSLGGDTTAPSGLYARLCYAFLVRFVVDILYKKFTTNPNRWSFSLSV